MIVIYYFHNDSKLLNFILYIDYIFINDYYYIELKK